jgi:3-hydroxyacyl-CoA dehydrogenase
MSANWNNIELLIVGAGTMGASLAQNYAQNGFNVGLLDVSDEMLQRGFSSIERELEFAKGKIFSAKDISDIRSRIIGTTNYEQACKGKELQLVIEAATERLDIKQKIFVLLDSLTSPRTVLATNSSSLDANVLAQVTKRPDKVVWMHYFYLPHKNRAAEFAGTNTASYESKLVAKKFLKLGGKIPTHIRGSRKGGVADIIFVALLLEATRMLEEGYDISTIETAGKKAYNIPIGFLELMDATGLPVGLYSMQSFSDTTNPKDTLYKVYGNFFAPRQNYVDLISKYNRAKDVSEVKWIRDRRQLTTNVNPKTVEELANRFLAIGFLTATECVDAKLITIEDLELLTQNAFLWNKGPFTLMNELGAKKVSEVIHKREELAVGFGQYFPLCNTLKKIMKENHLPSFHCSLVISEKESSGAVRRITLNNPRASNAMNNNVFEELKEEFSKANNDTKCKVIVFDTAPIKSFIAGADVKAFIARVKKKDFETIVRETTEWQRIIFHIMTGTKKPKIAIVDGQTFGGGVEIASAFSLDENSLVLITNRTSFALPETRLGIYPGLRGTLNLPQVIFKHTNDTEMSVALARYFILAGGIATSSPQMIYHLGFADTIVPQQKRDDAVEIIAQEIIKNKGAMISKEKLNEWEFEKLPTQISFEEQRELQIVTELFSQADFLPTLYAQARGYLPLHYTGEMKTFAEKIVRRVAQNSPNAVFISNFLISRGFENFLNGVDNDSLALFELEHYLKQVFEHPDALIGMEAMMNGKFAEFKRRYPM